MSFIVHITGPDDIHEFDDENTALKEANEINKLAFKAKWENDNPELYPTVIALVYTQEEFANLNQD